MCKVAVYLWHCRTIYIGITEMKKEKNDKLQTKIRHAIELCMISTGAL